MLDSYPLSTKLTKVYIKIPATIYNQKTVAKKSDFFVSSSTPEFSATRYRGLTFGDATGNRTPVTGETVRYNYRYTMAPYCAFRRRILKTRWSFYFKTTLTRRRHFIGECSTSILYASLAKPVKPQTNLTFPAYLVGRLDLTRFSIEGYALGCYL